MHSGNLRRLLLALVVSLGTDPAVAQIRVNPTGVNVNAQGATTVFLTFGGLVGYEAVEAFWCGELISAAPAIGLRCDPSTIFGQLPLRYERATGSGMNALTDIMTIPPSVARRAYQAAEAGAVSSFYYVRRFRSTQGAPDQFVAVTCRLSGGGARTPLSLTDVRMRFRPEIPVLHVAPGDAIPLFEAAIAYTGSGRLTGRWEIVLPGDELPSSEDLLTEATLPLEQRGTQRRYAQLERFNVLLPPNGRVVLPGPDPSRLPTTSDGVYYVLLRVEASSEKEGDSNLGAVAAGAGIVPSGAVAGFPMPMLRYIVGSGLTPVDGVTAARIALLTPATSTLLDSAVVPTFTWQPNPQALLYRIDFETERGERVLSALVHGDAGAYNAPPWFAARAAVGGRGGGDAIRWRVSATDAAGRVIARSDWRLQQWRRTAPGSER